MNTVNINVAVDSVDVKVVGTLNTVVLKAYIYIYVLIHWLLGKLFKGCA